MFSNFRGRAPDAPPWTHPCYFNIGLYVFVHKNNIYARLWESHRLKKTKKEKQKQLKEIKDIV
jgi:hypothetical protein